MLHVVSSTRELAAYRARLRWFGGLVGVVSLLLLGRIAWMQLVRGSEYAALARSNFLRVGRISPDRGLVHDVRGRPVAVNRPSYTVTATPHFLAQGEGDALGRLIEYVDLEDKEAKRLRERVAEAKGLDRFERIVVRRDVDRDALALIETHRRELPGVHIEASSHRTYPGGELAAHLVGYMNQINAEELEVIAPDDYRAGNYLGRSGVERAYERVLRGVHGLERVVVDARGVHQDLRELAASEEESAHSVVSDLIDAERKVDAIPGKTLVLTADMRLQGIMATAMRGYPSGAIVAVEPRTGRILGMYSKPTFDPSSWTGRLTREEKDAVDENPYRPMMNKAVWSYFPGSTYKVVTALAALEEGVVTPDEKFECRGYHEFGNRIFRCWNRAGHGEVDLRLALKHSCDVWFYQVAERLGVDRLAEYARDFGFGSRTGLGLNGESAGLVPTREWHEKHSAEGFQYGFALNTAVGQGDTRVTPLQLALAYAAVANGGKLYYPQIVEQIKTADGRTLIEYAPRLRGRLRASDEHLRLIVEALAASVNEEGGTAYESRIDGIRVAGKTGTAQVRGLNSRITVEESLRYRLRDHAWFVAYAPADDPQIVVVAFLEHGGSGGKHAAPVAMEVVARYFRDVRGVVPSLPTAAVVDGQGADTRAE